MPTSDAWSNVAAIAIGLAAILSSSMLTWRALRLNQTANHLPIVLNLLAPHRTAEFLTKEKHVWDNLKDYDPALGFSRCLRQ